MCGSVCARDSVTVKLSRIFASVTKNLDDLCVIFLSDRFSGMSEHLSGNSEAYVTDLLLWFGVHNLSCCISHLFLLHTHRQPTYSVVMFISKYVQLLTFVKVLLHSMHMHMLRGILHHKFCSQMIYLLFLTSVLSSITKKGEIESTSRPI